jgi:hypothetical protein
MAEPGAYRKADGSDALLERDGAEFLRISTSTWEAGSYC